MKYTIFTGIHNGKCFFDAYTDEDIKANESDYIGDERFDYEISEEEIEAMMKENSQDDRILDECLNKLSLNRLSQSDYIRFLRKLYRKDVECELINDAIHEHLREITLEGWKQDCMDEVGSKYKESNGRINAD